MGKALTEGGGKALYTLLGLSIEGDQGLYRREQGPLQERTLPVDRQTRMKTLPSHQFVSGR